MSYPFLSKLTGTGRPLDELVGNIIGVAVGASVNHAQAAVNVIDFYLDDSRTSERKHIVELIHNTDSAATARKTHHPFFLLVHECHPIFSRS